MMLLCKVVMSHPVHISTKNTIYNISDMFSINAVFYFKNLKNIPYKIVTEFVTDFEYDVIGFYVTTL